MNTIIIEHADNKVTNAIKALMDVLGLPVKIAAEEEWVPVEGVITNPKVIAAIERYESGNSVLTPFTDQLKEQLLKTQHAEV
jgi:hypothetical protein